MTFSAQHAWRAADAPIGRRASLAMLVMMCLEGMVAGANEANQRLLTRRPLPM